MPKDNDRTWQSLSFIKINQYHAAFIPTCSFFLLTSACCLVSLAALQAPSPTIPLPLLSEENTRLDFPETNQAIKEDNPDQALCEEILKNYGK
ncbi:MAG: hypothetical protein HC912_02700 [Saprospiraceae bacterium]|nr:hypothetical protein [Saprospiraceae bacterium]